MWQMLIMLAVQYAADLLALLSVAVLVTLVVTAYICALARSVAPQAGPAPSPPRVRWPRRTIRCTDPDAPGRARPRAPGHQA